MADSIPKTGPTGSRNKWLFCLAFLAGLGMLLAGLSLYFLPKDNTPEAGIQNVRACGVLGEPENTLDYLVLGDSFRFWMRSLFSIFKSQSSHPGSTITSCSSSVSYAVSV